MFTVPSFVFLSSKVFPIVSHQNKFSENGMGCERLIWFHSKIFLGLIMEKVTLSDIFPLPDEAKRLHVFWENGTLREL
jgi:hypothetical protein